MAPKSKRASHLAAISRARDLKRSVELEQKNRDILTEELLDGEHTDSDIDHTETRNAIDGAQGPPPPLSTPLQPPSQTSTPPP